MVDAPKIVDSSTNLIDKVNADIAKGLNPTSVTLSAPSTITTTQQPQPQAAKAPLPLVGAGAGPAKTFGATPPLTKPAAIVVSPTGSRPTAMRGTPPFSMGRPPTAVGRWLNLLAYGKPGAGKTTLLGTAVDIAEMNDVLYVDAERGNLAMEENPRIKGSEKLMENRISVTTFMEVAKVHEYLKSHCKFRDENNEAELRKSEAWIRGCQPDDIEVPRRFNTVLVDSLTEIDIYCTYGLLGITQEKVLHGESSDIEVARFDEFRKNNQMVQMLCRAFRDLPIHFLATAGRTYAEDDLRKRYYSPALTGQLKTQVPGFFDIVGYLDSSKVGDAIERRMYIKPIGNFEAKNRRSVYQKDYFEDPYMKTIMEGVKLLKPPAPKGDQQVLVS